MPSLKLHHVGCAVSSLEEALRPYMQAMGFSQVSKIVEVASQNVRVCFIQTAPRVYGTRAGTRKGIAGQQFSQTSAVLLASLLQYSRHRRNAPAARGEWISATLGL